MLRRIAILNIIMLALAGNAHASSPLPFIPVPAVVVVPFPASLEFVSAPSANQTLEKPPESVRMTFSQVIRPGVSTMKVYDPYGNTLPTSELIVDGANMSVRLPTLESAYTGTYRVEWTAACVCTTIPDATDNFYFTVQ